MLVDIEKKTTKDVCCIIFGFQRRRRRDIRAASEERTTRQGQRNQDLAVNLPIAPRPDDTDMLSRRQEEHAQTSKRTLSKRGYCVRRQAMQRGWGYLHGAHLRPLTGVRTFNERAIVMLNVVESKSARLLVSFSQSISRTV